MAEKELLLSLEVINGTLLPSTLPKRSFYLPTFITVWGKISTHVNVSRGYEHYNAKYQGGSCFTFTITLLRKGGGSFPTLTCHHLVVWRRMMLQLMTQELYLEQSRQELRWNADQIKALQSIRKARNSMIENDFLRLNANAEDCSIPLLG
jgi:hypothetical protein